ncbi:MAG: type II toxin-antitoxin system VapC family toxin [Tepidiformaceae bacterium]
MRVLLDTSAFYAFASPADQHHDAARPLFRSTGLQFRTTSMVVGETYTLLNDRHGYGLATRWIDALRASGLTEVVHFSARQETAIWETLRTFTGIPLSYQDASLIVLGRIMGVRDVFTFDSDFRQAGLNVVP